jgi:hypothetical protein
LLRLDCRSKEQLYNALKLTTIPHLHPPNIQFPTNLHIIQCQERQIASINFNSQQFPPSKSPKQSPSSHQKIALQNPLNLLNNRASRLKPKQKPQNNKKSQTANGTKKNHLQPRETQRAESHIQSTEKAPRHRYRSLTSHPRTSFKFSRPAFTFSLRFWHHVDTTNKKKSSGGKQKFLLHIHPAESASTDPGRENVDQGVKPTPL